MRKSNNLGEFEKNVAIIRIVMFFGFTGPSIQTNHSSRETNHSMLHSYQVYTVCNIRNIRVNALCDLHSSLVSRLLVGISVGKEFHIYETDFGGVQPNSCSKCGV
jgi:hypothetical protein